MNVSDYLIKSLENIGISHIFGLPGDYNFEILYSVNRNPNVEWIGCTNELNAGYAADGYARIKGFGAIITTYGVGELSAINAIAGSYSENVPVINIVGVPETKKIDNHILVHHNFLNPNYYAFEQAYKSVVETTAYLSKENAKMEIDRVLSIFIKERRPVYIAIPIDVAQENLDEEIGYKLPTSNLENLNIVIETIKKMVDNSKAPVFLADNILKRYKLENKFMQLVEKVNYPVSNFLMGMGAINSSYKNYLGTYLYDYGNNLSKEFLFNTDCLISFGLVYSDLNSFGFSLPYNPEDYIVVYGSYTIINHKKYEDVMMKDVIEKLITILPKRHNKDFCANLGYEFPEEKNEQLTSKYIYPRIQKFLKQNDYLFIETGIIPHGVAGIKLADGVVVNSQTLWGSIGWATPSAFGAGIALKDTDKRVVLFTGDGSHQLTATEVSNMMAHNLNIVIIVLNNNGYTVERILSKNPYDKFNDILHWNYSLLPQVFKGDVLIQQARTDVEFDEALKNANKNNKINYIEIFTDKMDIPSISESVINKIKHQL
jgi:indolepyruvate decarboxylase